MGSKPIVSIIVPFHNAEKYIEKCVESLINQNIDPSLFEIILVNNNSSDNSIELIKKYPGVTIVNETKKGSYAARNCGVREANGEIYAFIDSDCIAESSWIKNSIEYLKQNNNNLVIAGAVEFLKSGVTVWGLFDTTTFLNQEHASKGGSAVTANLIVPKRIFQSVGFFNDVLQSGGDVEWTRRCIGEGHTIKYSARVKVYHPVRNTFSESSEKCYRVGYGNGQLIKKNQRYYALVKPSMVLPILKSFTSDDSPINQNEYKALDKIKLFGCSLILQYFNYKGKIKGSIN